MYGASRKKFESFSAVQTITTTRSSFVTHNPQPTMVRPRLRIPRLGASMGASTTFNAASARRCLHNVPRLRHDYTETGIPNLMSPAGFSIAWSDYMTLATEKLNALTAGL